MSERILLIEPRDPVIFRDAKPFSAGSLPATSLPFPLPTTIAGAIRTRCGADTGYTDDVIARLLKVEQTGPILAVKHWRDSQWQLLFPAPADCLPFVSPDDQNDAELGRKLDFVPLRPADKAAGTDLPDDLLPLTGAPDKKPASHPPSFWTSDFTSQWLANPQQCDRFEFAIGFPSLPRQRRVQLAIQKSSQAAQDHMLFSTEGLEFQHKSRLGKRYRHAIITRVRNADGAIFPPVSPIGGERRLAFWHEPAGSEIAWPSPPPLTERLRVQLITPGAFKAGWRPEWCAGDGGFVPSVPGLKLQLVAAAVPRAVPISGWDFKEKRPKATRLLAPAGSVYFFNVLDGDPSKLWFQSICDDQADRNDGFGIALCGVW